jgi:hypothetical protein
MDAMAKFDLSARVYIHAAGQTFPKTTLYNAICDMECQSSREPMLLVDFHGHCFSAEEIDEIRHSPEFKKHRAELRSRGHDRD